MAFFLSIFVLIALQAPAFAQAAESIPDFCASPTKTARQGARDWSAADTWTPAGVPTAGDVVVIPERATVTYGARSSDLLVAVCVRRGGALTFQTGASTRLTVTTLHVLMGGSLSIGDPEGPCVTPPHVAEIAFGGALNTKTDPEQFGLGLIVDGRLRVCGAAKTAFVRLGEELDPSQTEFGLAAAPIGWKSGDDVAVPDSRGRNLLADAAFLVGQRSRYVHENEVRTLSADVTTAEATVGTGVTFAHSGARDKRGTVVLHPHIGNLTRSVRFHSLNRTGNDRAHSMFHHMADVDVRYASFLDMGRTTSLDLHCTLRANGSAVDDVDCIMGSGRVTQTGRNQKGRYAVHFHKLMGPRNDTNTGYQGRFIGNVIRDSTKWPLTIHDSSYLLIQDNVIWRGQGACVMFEEGNEHFNVLDGNLIVGCNGRTLADNDVDVMAGCSSNCADPREHGGREGSGIWARGFNNYFRNNVSAGHWNDWQQIVSSAGYKFENGMTLTNAGMVNSTGAGVKVRVPKFRGADLLDRGESTEEFMRQLPLLEFANNEAYGGIATCLTVWYHQDPDSPSGNRTASLKDFKCWGFYEDAFFMYPLSRYALTGWRVYGPYNSLNRAYSHGVYNGDYSVADVSISDTIIHNVATCMSGFAISGSYSVSNVDLACDFGFERKMFQSGSNGSRPVGPQRFTFTNVTWEGIGGTPVRIQGHTSTNDVFLYMHWCATTEAGDPCADGGAFDQPNLPHTTTVRNLNGNGLQYDVYFIEQGNRDIAGGRAPCLDSKSHREVRGIVCGAQAWSPGQSAAVVPQGESQKR